MTFALICGCSAAASPTPRQADEASMGTESPNDCEQEGESLLQECLSQNIATAHALVPKFVSVTDEEYSEDELANLLLESLRCASSNPLPCLYTVHRQFQEVFWGDQDYQRWRSQALATTAQCDNEREHYMDACLCGDKVYQACVPEFDLLLPSTVRHNLVPCGEFRAEQKWRRPTTDNLSLRQRECSCAKTQWCYEYDHAIDQHTRCILADDIPASGPAIVEASGYVDYCVPVDEHGYLSFEVTSADTWKKVCTDRVVYSSVGKPQSSCDYPQLSEESLSL